MLLKVFLLLSMLIQLGAAIASVSLIRRTRYNISWILISAGFVLMALRRLIEFSALFWETRIISKDEVNSWIGILISLLMLTGVIFIRQIFNLQDRIDELRKENESRVLKAIIQAEEKARQSFARELHDGLGPVLSSVKMIVSAIELDKMDTSNKRIVERACGAADEAINALKEISNHLSPHLLQNYGLVKALETSVPQLLLHTGIRFALHGNISLKRYNYDIEINAFRIISELLNNSIKHGNPRTVTIELKDTVDFLQIDYHDDGTGFSLNNISQPHQPGMGLDNIRSRIKSLNGDYFIDSEPEKGVRVNIQIPL